MKYILSLLFILIFCLQSFAQYNPRYDEYKHYSIESVNDTINFHIYSQKNIRYLKNILLFVQGSGASPLFSIKRSGNTESVNSPLLPFNLDEVPESYAFVVISKKGIPFSTEDCDYKPSKNYYENESLDYRVRQADRVISYIKKNLIEKTSKIVVIGHSEGSDVVAKLGTINKDITHIGYWAGGANSQYYDFVLFVRKEIIKGNLTEKEGMLKIDSLLNTFKDITDRSNDIDKFWNGNSYYRWSHFSEPAINNLLKINIPLFVGTASLDDAVPVESAYLIPIEFIRNKKRNLRFKVYPNMDHSFRIKLEGEAGKWVAGWMTVFNDFMNWVGE